MAWMCPYCRVNYARRKDHDESATSKECKKRALEEANKVYSALLAKRKAENPQSEFMTKELKSAWAKVRRLQGY